MMNLFVTLKYVSVNSGIFMVLAILYNYKYLDHILKIAAAFFIVSTLFDLLLELTLFLHIYNNLPLIHIYIMLSVIFFGIIYYHAFFNALLKKTVIVLFSMTVFLLIINTIFIDGIWEYPSVSNTVLSVLMIFISLAYFYQLLSRQEFLHIERQGMFWINSGILFYFSLNLFLFMLFKKIAKAHLGEYYMIHDVTNIIANLLYTAGLLCKPQKT